MVRTLGIVLAVVVVGFVAVVMMQPDEMVVERTATIAAPAEVVYDQLDDFVAWQAWNPWQTLDPNQVTTLEGPPAGVGAAYTWEGNDQVGKGRMEIVEALPGQKVAWSLDFIEPFAQHATTHILLEPAGEGTTVTWRMVGENDFAGKMAGLFLDMDAMVGADFDRGLTRLGDVSIAAAQAAAEAAAAEAAAAEAAAAAAAEGAVEAPPAEPAP